VSRNTPTDREPRTPFRLRRCDVELQTLETADPAGRIIQIDAQLLPGLPAGRRFRSFPGRYMTAHTGVPAAGKAVLAGGPLLQKQMAVFVDNV
jgi:hypothetical protein